MSNITLKDFQPVNTWVPDNSSCYWSGEARYLQDMSTGRKYFNESQAVVGFKCFLLTAGTPIIHTIASLVHVAILITKLVTLSHFWSGKDDEIDYSFKARLNDAAKDLLKIMTTPIAFVGLELAAIYGIVNPYDGRKLYASIERAQYGHFILAPCFQPEATHHAFGGDINIRNQF